MRFQTQSDEFCFHIKEIIIEHYPDGPDGEMTEVYRLSKDPAIQDMVIGQEFEGGSMGMVRSGNASFLVIDKDNLDPPKYIPPVEEDDDDAGTEQADAPEAGDANDEPASVAVPVEAEADDESSFPLVPVLIGGGAVVAVGAAVIIINAKRG
jgi:hypothetical protein